MDQATGGMVAGLVIVALTMLILSAFVKLVGWLAGVAIDLRDDLRSRYADERWKPHPVDLAGLPLWLVVEVVCLVGGILAALLLAWSAYSAARGFRDWWHAGQGRR